MRKWLPSGDRLPEATWQERHRAVLWLLWLHLPALWVLGVAGGHEPLVLIAAAGILVHGGFVVLASLAASQPRDDVQRENVRRLLDAAGDGIYGVDRSGRITFVNPMLCKLLGEERSSLEGTDAHDALGHGTSTGTPVQRADCPMCVDLSGQNPLEVAEATLRADDDAVPVEYVVRAGEQDFGRVVTVRDLRDRRALEDERRQAEAERDRLASIVEASPNLALIGSSDGRFMWMNRAGRRLLGFDETEDITAYRIEDMFSTEEMARVYAEDMPALSREGDWQCEWRLQARDGTQIPVWAIHHVHRDSEGNPVYVSGIMRDLRPQLEEERARSESERRLAAAELVAGLGSWEWNTVTDKVMWSPGMYRLHGMQQGDGEESLEAWLATVHPDDREGLRARADGTRSKIGTEDFTYRAVRADGRQIVIQGRGETFPNEQGEPVVMVGTLLDITERHAAAEALRESEERARGVIATAGDAYIQFSTNGVVTDWNNQAERSFGWARQEVVGNAVQELMLAPDPATFERGVGLDVEDGQEPPDRQRFETTLRHRSGREFPAEVTAWTVPTGNGPLLSCFVRDIGERLAAERAKDEFVSVVGHELRTPLTSIHGALGLLRAGLLGELTERGQHMVDIAVHNTDRLVRLINDILDIERLNSGGIALRRGDNDVAALAVRSAEAMRPLAQETGVLLEVDADAEIVWADPDRIEQTLTNLLSNAIKFSPHGGTVRLDVRRDGDEVTVQVRDQGRGIPPEHLERIFDRFQQVDGSDSREKGGTGLGLAICRTIVEQHGGRIWAESMPGEGATLTFTLPAARPRPAGAESGPRALGPMLLLVEDDQGLADVLAQRFGRLGIAVHHASTARQAIEICADVAPDLLVLDLTLPDEEGYAVVAQISRDPRLQDVPVAVYTASDLSDGDRERLQLGRTQFFTKGRVTPDQLERHVVDLLGHLTAPSREAAHA